MNAWTLPTQPVRALHTSTYSRIMCPLLARSFVSLNLSLSPFPRSLFPCLPLSRSLSLSSALPLSLSLFLFLPIVKRKFQRYQTSDTPRSIEVICTHRQGKVLTLDREAKAAAGISARMPKRKPLRTALLDFCRHDLQVLWEWLLSQGGLRCGTLSQTAMESHVAPKKSNPESL